MKRDIVKYQNIFLFVCLSNIFVCEVFKPMGRNYDIELKKIVNTLQIELMLNIQTGKLDF